MTPAPPSTSHPAPLRRHAVIALAGALVLAGCGVFGGGSGEQAAVVTTAPAPASTLPATVAVATVPTTAPLTVPPTAPPTIAPVCAVTVQPGDSLIGITERAGITIADLELENGIVATDTIHPGQVFDVCIANDVDDVTGTSRLAPPPEAVTLQQTELNELFAGTSLLPLDVDGDSGNYTRQAACAARMLLGLPVSNGHLPAGSAEEATIFAATAADFRVPAGAPTDATKWILIDKTCQVIVTGEGADRVVDVYPTSTGEEGHETHDVRALAFRFDPATENDGWHDSASYPVEGDNPLNGNMYKPLYFNEGQAIHGAGFIPPFPRSKGCARTFPWHQDQILEWLGLDGVTEATWNARQIDVMVVVQGRYVDRTVA